MVFGDVENLDACRSTFNQAENQITIHSYINYFSIFGSQQTSHLVAIGPKDDLRQPSSGPENISRCRSPRQRPQSNVISIGDNLARPDSGARTLSRSSHFVTYRLSDATAIIGTAIGLIVQITSLLNDRRDSSNNRRDFALQLKLLNQALALTGFAIEVYGDKQLGQSLLNTVTPTVAQCSIVLQDLFGYIKGV